MGVLSELDRIGLTEKLISDQKIHFQLITIVLTVERATVKDIDFVFKSNPVAWGFPLRATGLCELPILGISSFEVKKKRL